MERLFGSIPDILKDLGHDPGASEAVVLAAWKQCAGELISKRTAARQFFENRLVVAVQDATWRAHLEDLAPQLVARLNAELGDGTVKFVEFRVDSSASKGREPSSPVIEADLAELPDSLRDAALAIGDTELRASFLSAAAAYLEKK